LVVRPVNRDEVRVVLRGCTMCDESLSILDGGHSAAGYCLQQNGVVLNMRAMNKTTADLAAGTLTVEAGARFSDVYQYTIDQAAPWIPIGGGCPQVGVAGFTLGGGWSFLSRSFGLAIDNLISCDLMLANGSIVTASADSNPD